MNEEQIIDDVQTEAKEKPKKAKKEAGHEFKANVIHDGKEYKKGEKHDLSKEIAKIFTEKGFI